MCGRFVAAYDADRVADDWNARVSSSVPPASWNVAPNTPIRVLTPDKRGALWLTAAYWSLIPEWMRDEVPSFPTFNARIETALDRPTFRDSARKHRLIVPMTAYYEWDRHKHPYCFQARDGGVLWAAGLFSIRPADGARRLSCTILTRTAVGAAARVHDRMPVLLDRAAAMRWMRPTTDPTGLLADAAEEGARTAGTLDSWQVAPLRGDGPKLMEPMEQATLF